MDLNNDGNIDILSGSYSRHAQPMAGEFHVLYGNADGTFKTSVILNNSEGEPLEITAGTGPEGNPSVTDVICTRPYAVDLNADGKLDIVSGNFTGSFALFMSDANGNFSSSTMLTDAANNQLKVEGGHSDPSFVDWDGDGDLDMLSGAGAGGAFLFENVGDKTAPKFAAATELVASNGKQVGFDIELSDPMQTGPQRSTRVVAVDYNQDGKLDLLVGDSATIVTPANGLSASQCTAQLDEWKAEQTAMQAAFEKMSEEEARSEENSKKFMNHYQKLEEIVVQDRTGFVWLYLGK